MYDWIYSLVGLVGGTVVGLTGMGGGALLTPVLVLLLGVPPAAAVSSDVVASLLMKPVGAAVHWRRGTVNRRLVALLASGSVPGALLGALVFNRLGARGFDGSLRVLLGAALLVAAGSLAYKAWRGSHPPDGRLAEPLRLAPVRTVAIGAVGGFIVGITSVGSGSLMIVLLMLLYPALSSARLVGTDLAQAIPLVAAATVGHLLFGSVNFALTGWLLVGALPGVYIGARWSSLASDGWLRPLLSIVLAASGLKLVGAPTVFVVACAVAAGGAWAARRLVRPQGGDRKQDRLAAAPNLRTDQG